MEFRRYSKIYRTDYVGKINIPKLLVETSPLNRHKYCVLEKLDGTNVTIVFDNKGSCCFGKKNGWIEKNEKFYDFWDAIKLPHNEDLLHFLDRVAAFSYNVMSIISNKVDIDEVYMRFYCEMVGPNIQKNTNYSDKTTLYLLDAFIYARDLGVLGFLPYNKLLNMMRSNTIESRMPPLLLKECTLSDALNYPLNFDSKIIKAKNNPAEGVIIRPWSENLYIPDTRHRLMFKRHASTN